MNKRFAQVLFTLFSFTVVIFSQCLSSYRSYTEKNFCDNVLRFHVIANSDSDEDIAYKNSLAEKLMPYVEEVFAECDSFSSAKKTASENCENIRFEANKILDSFGVKEKARVFVSEKHYEERSLEGIVYPSGDYLSIRVVVGEGKGHNWWCVLFSPLTDVGIVKKADTKEEKGVKLRFKILDVICGREKEN